MRHGKRGKAMKINFIGDRTIRNERYFLYEIAGFELAIRRPSLGSDPVDGGLCVDHGGIFHTASVVDPKMELISFEPIEGGEDFDEIVEAIEKDALLVLTAD